MEAMAKGEAVAQRILAALRTWMRQAPRRPFVLGICGAQGSGKSTAAAALRAQLLQEGRNAAILSLDDLYLGHAARQALAASVHPLLAVRGVPGTHDLALGHRIFDAASQPGPITLPRFDKSTDNPSPQPEIAQGPLDLLIFEGWCVGARPQRAADLIAPVNALERDQDSDGRWRQWVNAQLAGPCQRLFNRLDALVLLAAPDFAIVQRWRTQQEQELRTTRGGGMSDAEVRNFIAHYQRITEHLLRDMPGYADLTIRLDQERQIVG